MARVSKADDAAIKGQRKLSNDLIAAHDAAGLHSFFLEDAKVIAGDGSLITGADAIIEAFGAQFREPSFGKYVRTTQTLQIDQDGMRAAESGRWAGFWKGEGEDRTMSGQYLAVWRYTETGWKIESELFVTLLNRGS
ncbi:YybH family protein [Lacibacterium aquatile]|uniref:YybH family protein n=1 Tax=Lacibacterium aquatile TaxID=1168082 RepID=A0ABW5E0B7_9PROT